MAIGVLFGGTTMEPTSIETAYNKGSTVESNFNNEYLGCAGSTNKWAMVAHDPQSIHVLDTTLTTNRISAFYVSSASFDIEPEQIFFMNAYIYGAAKTTSNSCFVFRMLPDGSSISKTQTSGFTVWPMAFLG